MTPTLNYSAIQPMDAILCWGSRRNPVSGLIEIFARHDGVMGPSHVCLCRQAGHSTATPALVTGGPLIWTYTPPTIIEATWTFDGTVNGVRTKPLPQLLAEYPPGGVKHFALMPDARKRADLEAFYASCGQLDGVAHYSIPQLFRFMLPDTILDSITPDAETAKTLSVVCSGCAAWLLEACHVFHGVNPLTMAPADFLRLADPKLVGGGLFKPGVVI